jgi:hypothetical protein
VETVIWSVCVLRVACYSIGVRVNYIHRTQVRCRNIFFFILCIILDSSNTVYISFLAGWEANDDVWQCACTNCRKFCCYPIVITFICMETGEWQSDWYSEVLATLQYTVLLSESHQVWFPVHSARKYNEGTVNSWTNYSNAVYCHYSGICIAVTLHKTYLTHTLLIWRIWCALNNAGRWQMEFNLVFKRLNCHIWISRLQFV